MLTHFDKVQINLIKRNNKRFCLLIIFSTSKTSETIYIFEKKLMKKILVVFCLALLTFGYSQEKTKVDFPKNEIKGNALFLVLGAVEVTYERLLSEDSGLGVSVFFISEDDFETNFSVTPYYRAYFGKKPAAGFFVEGFAMLNSYVDHGYTTSNYVNGTTLVTTYVPDEVGTDFALGFGLGSKWVHRKGFVFEINAGIGRNLLSNNSPEVVGRGGITLGYRF